MQRKKKNVDHIQEKLINRNCVQYHPDSKFNIKRHEISYCLEAFESKCKLKNKNLSTEMETTKKRIK